MQLKMKMKLNNGIIIAGILLSAAIVALFVWFMVVRIRAGDPKEKLMDFCIAIITAIVGVWVVDKIISIKLEILTSEESGKMFDFITTISLMMFSYYFGTKSKTNE